MNTPKPALLLLPNLIGDHRHHQAFLPESVDRAVATLDGLIAESEQSGRRYLSRFTTKQPVTQIPIALYNEHTPDDHLDFLLEPIRNGERWGYVSEAGLPCIADPGGKLVQRARQSGIIVQAFVGPSSILLALMLSGMNGQRFMFHGYLHVDKIKRREQIIQLERRAENERATQLFMEAPYRNQQTLEIALEALQEDTLFCVAWDLTMPTQGVLSQPVKIWKKSPLPNLEKRTAIFLICL